ncbi:MAG: eukaryotic-like serine/threonine-protein kinase [Gaiellales bacterium]|nr:eukaryotic-like serine/threonine-protein kinase [Gaiellales bacterium]MDX6550543.1 eukaryotic-like serine/threonine-protein kinase [Gaiellales bacterium]
MSTVRADIGRYRIDRVLGRGGMALVYLGHDANLGRAVAIKLLADNLAGDESFRARFLREARMAAGLSHVNIVHVYDVGQDEDERPYIVMEFVDGESLAETIARERTLDPARVRRIALDCCAGLQHAHAAGLVHRDIKPHNLLLDRDDRVKIADFGVARSLDETQLTVAGSVLGSARYLAPEQAAGQPATPAADIYSLGATLYQLLCGRTPHDGETLSELMHNRGTRSPTPIGELNPDVPPALATAVMRCLNDDPRQRPASAATLSLALTADDSQTATHILSQPATSDRTLVMPSPAAPAAAGWHPSLGGGRRRLVTAAAIAALIVLVLLIALVTGGGGGAAKPPARPHVAAVTRGANAAEQAHNLARWIRQHSR